MAVVFVQVRSQVKCGDFYRLFRLFGAPNELLVLFLFFFEIFSSGGKRAEQLPGAVLTSPCALIYLLIFYLFNFHFAPVCIFFFKGRRNFLFFTFFFVIFNFQ